MQTRSLKPFILSAGGLLLAAALIRFLIVAGNSQVLSAPDPLLGIPLRWAALLAGAVELAVALFCLFGKQPGMQILSLAWLATVFMAWRAALLWQHCQPEGTCIGSLTDPLHLSRGLMGFLMDLIPFLFTIGAYAAAIIVWRMGGIPQTAATLKMFCPSCGGKIQFAAQNVGRKIPCPLCRTILILRSPENLKISCGFCHEHIEFPAHALGQKISCPHCNMTVILKEPL